MITPEPKPAMPGSEQCVPVAALEVDGTAPSVGDEFEFTGKGRATRVEDGHVYFEMTEINGQPVAAPPEAEAEGEPDSDDMIKAAMEADKANGG